MGNNFIGDFVTGFKDLNSLHQHSQIYKIQYLSLIIFGNSYLQITFTSISPSTFEKKKIRIIFFSQG